MYISIGIYIGDNQYLLGLGMILGLTRLLHIEFFYKSEVTDALKYTSMCTSGHYDNIELCLSYPLITYLFLF